MKYEVVAVRDNKTGIFMPPQFVPHVALAVRGFSDEINSGKGTLSAHPGDFEVWKMGTFDDSTGLFDTGSPEIVVKGTDVRNQVPVAANLDWVNPSKN